MWRLPFLLLRKAIPFALALLAFASGALCAQEYSFRSFGVAEGLNNLAIRQIYQDRVGFIWVSTEDGIFRYDGDRFEAFAAEQGIPSNSGLAFGDAPDGSLLAGGDVGLYRLSGNHFEKLAADFNTISSAQGIESDGKGHTYLGTDAGLVELYSQPGPDQFGMRRFPQPAGTSGPAAYGILVDGDIVWYGCGQQLCRMDAAGTRVFGRESGLPDRELQVIRKDRAGNLWVRARNAGVFEWPAGKAKFERPKLPFSPEDIGGVPAVDDDGRILLTTPVGLLIGDEKGWQTGRPVRRASRHSLLSLRRQTAFSLDRIGWPGTGAVARVQGMGELLDRERACQRRWYTKSSRRTMGRSWWALKRACFAESGAHSACRFGVLRG